MMGLQMTISRRGFLSQTAAVSTAFGALPLLATASAHGQTPSYINEVQGYGPLQSDPNGLFDLPAGFDYVSFSDTGTEMSDGLLVPGDHDGMACFPGLEDGQVILVRNHELSPDQADKSPFGPNAERLNRIDPSKLYDYQDGGVIHLGGTSTVHVDLQSRSVVREFLSVGGTERNCAGGPTPWGSWITCEESRTRAGENGLHAHGYAFEVPARSLELVQAVPLTAMGRFNREACATDPRTSIVYQTEDARPSLITRFLPAQPGELLQGGRLQALAIKGMAGVNTNNWPEADVRIPVGQPMQVEWIDVDGVDNPHDDMADRLIVLGAANFTRGEGMWWGNDEVYFCCTDGGEKRSGQIWRYRPSAQEGQPGEASEPGEITLFYESQDTKVMDYCDNITVAPWGDLIVVEDGPDDEFIRGVTPDGRAYTIGRNADMRGGRGPSEITGPCFSPDGSTLFFNVQDAPGRTFAVRGPWLERSLAAV